VKFNNRENPPIVNAVVSYTENATKFFEVENHFCGSIRKKFNTLFEAEKWVLIEIANAKKTLAS